MSLFDHSDYKSFLKAKIAENQKHLGYKGKLAQATGCQRAYLSQVINTHLHFTPDHAAGLAEFWELTEDERDYFLELVNYARAATPALRKVIGARLAALRDARNTVSGRIKKPAIENLHQQIHYYSSWHYSAIHILLTIPRYRTPHEIASRLGLSKAAVLSALGALVKLGLIEKRGEAWHPVSFDLHLPERSPLGVSNHLNWRNRALQDSQSPHTEGVHFTAVYSLSEKDYLKIRARLLALISETRETALASEEEDLFSFCCDLFRA